MVSFERLRSVSTALDLCCALLQSLRSTRASCLSQRGSDRRPLNNIPEARRFAPGDVSTHSAPGDVGTHNRRDNSRGNLRGE